MPPTPQPKDPVLPNQPIVTQQPVGLGVGRKDEDSATSKLNANKARKKLRIKRNVGTETQVSGGGAAAAKAMKSSGVNTSG